MTSPTPSSPWARGPGPVPAMVDTHCHLDWHAFDPDRDAVIARAREAGVRRMVTIGVDLERSRAALALAGRYAGVFAAIGVHPNDTAAFDEATLAGLHELAGRGAVVAIGEIGLDHYWKKVAPDVQVRALQAQLELAADLGLPVIVHSREAMEDTLAVLAQWIAGLRAAGAPLAARPGVLHSFSGGPAAAGQALELGFCLGISGPVTYPKADTLRAVVAAAPSDRLLVETDAPFLTPHPHRGERNEPARVQLVAAGVASARGVSLEEIAAQTTANAEWLFGLAA